MIKKQIFAALLLLPCIATALPLQLRWRAEVSDPKPYSARIFRGESVTLSAQLRQYGKDMALPAGVMAKLYYQTNGMDRVYWPVPGTASTNGLLAATWTPALDAGADRYYFFLGASIDGSNIIYRAYGQIQMLNAPGAVPNELPMPVKSINFATIEVSNAPWIEFEEDPQASAALKLHTDNKNNPHETTPEKIGALPARLDGVTYNLDGGYWFQLYNPYARALLTTSTLQFFMGSTMTLGVDSESIRINGRNYFWPAKAQDETLLTESDIYGLASKSYVDSSFVSKAYVDTTFPTKSYVESTRWQADDIATNLSYNVVVSNGHWIIRESLK